MIESFRHKGLKKFYEKGDCSTVRANMAARIEEILTILEAVETVAEADVPGYRLHPLDWRPQRLLERSCNRKLADHLPFREWNGT